MWGPKGLGIRLTGVAPALLATSLAMVSATPDVAEGNPVLPIPHVFTRLAVTPAPAPIPSEERVPVSLRLAASIWTDDGSHPPASTEVRFDLDRQLRLDLAGVPRCPWAPLQAYPAFDWDGCAAATVASGRTRWEVAFPEQKALRVGGQVTVYRGRENQLLIRTWVPAPVNGQVVMPVKLRQTREGIHGLRATAFVPGVAGDSGSLVYLGLRFRKGLFSAACPKRRLLSGVTDTFADATKVSAGLIFPC